MSDRRLSVRNMKDLHNAQRGVVTLVISLVILFLSTYVVFNVSKAILMEQKISNNDTRAKKAFEAAEAGMNAAISYLSDDPDVDADGCIDFIFDTDMDGNTDSYALELESSSVVVSVRTTPCVPPGAENMQSITLVSQGFSDDRSATRRITTRMDTIDPLPNRPENPLTVRGGVTIGGSATVHNPEGFSTIWSGNSVQLSGNSVTTEVPDLLDEGYPACMDFPETCELVETSDAQGVGVDVVENDASLGNLTPEEFFTNFFGMDMDTYRASMATIDTAGTAAENDADLAGHEVIWVDGDVEMTGVTVGCTEEANNGDCDADKRKPSILIIDGDVEFKGNCLFFGIVFILGDATLTGNVTVHGSATVAGSAVDGGAGGSLDIWFNSNMLDQTALAGASAGTAGSWKDF
jgi:hypothetical protein